MLIAFALTALALLGAAVAYQQVGVRRDARRCPMPGRLVRAGGAALHVHALGEGAPAVVFLSGIATSCLNWTTLQREISRHTLAVAYDRPGLGWSPLGPRGLTAASHARHLRGMLDAAGVPTPVVLVTHSFGAYIALLLAHHQADVVAGIVMIDPITWHEWVAPNETQRRTLRGGAFVARVGALLAALGVVRAAVGRFRRGSEGAGRAILGAFGPVAVEAVSRVMGEVGKMPRETWDAIQAHWTRPRAFLSMARHFAALPASAREVRDAMLASPAPMTVPLVVLGAGTATDTQRAAQRELATASSLGRYEIVGGAGHWIHLDRLDVVRDAILETVRRAAR